MIMSRTGCQPRASAMSCEAAQEAAAAASVREADSAVRGGAGGAAAAALPAGGRSRAFYSTRLTAYIAFFTSLIYDVPTRVEVNCGGSKQPRDKLDGRDLGYTERGARLD